MIAQFTLLPIGTKSDSISKILAKAMKIVARSGLDYKAGPMGTSIEGEWFEVMNLINLCRDAILREAPRVQIVIHIDDRPGKGKRIEAKVKSLEKKMGMKLKK